MATPFNEAFCLLVLKNGWELRKWECENAQATAIEKNTNAPSFMFTSKGSGRQTEGYRGWSQPGITLYNKLVEELMLNQKNLDNQVFNHIDVVVKMEMEIIEESFFHWAQIWDDKNVLHLSGGKNRKRLHKKDEPFLNAVQIFGWKDGN